MPTLSIGIYVPLTRGAYTLIDAEDYNRVVAFKWQYLTDYAARSEHGPKPRRIIMLHKWLLGLEYSDSPVDHWNMDKLDNRKGNLRKATRSQNKANGKKYKRLGTSCKFKGVHKWTRHDGKIYWQAAIQVNGVRTSLGTYKTPEEAAMAYDRAAIDAWGEFARPNFVGAMLKDVMTEEEGG